MKDTPIQPAIDDDSLYDTRAAAAYIGFGHNTLRNSRSTGKLAGVAPPAHVAMGAKRLYLGRTLKEWRWQFIDPTTASQVA